MEDEAITRNAEHTLMGRSRQCTATNRKGERGGNSPIKFGFVCVMHGGDAPATRAAALRRMLTLLDPALAHLTRVLEARPFCAHCGRSDADRDPVVLRACQMVLDRCGLGPSATLEVKTDDTAWMQYLEEGEVDQIIKLHLTGTHQPHVFAHVALFRPPDIRIRVVETPFLISLIVPAGTVSS